MRKCLAGSGVAALLSLSWPALAGNPDIVTSARSQVGVTLRYDPAYQSLGYPGGDVPMERGVCTDVVACALRAGYGLPPARDASGYLPGDIVAWNLGRGILHIGVVSDRKSVTGTPLVVHNIGAGAREDDILSRFAIIGQYRLPARPAGAVLPPPGDGIPRL